MQPNISQQIRFLSHLSCQKFDHYANNCVQLMLQILLFKSVANRNRIDMQGQQPVIQVQMPKTAFNLIQKVGSIGKYQYISLFIWCAMWFVCGNLLLATPFLFYQQSYVCENKNINPEVLENQSCNQYVCSLPVQARNQFLEQSYGIISIPNQDGNDYHCQKQFLIDSVSSLIYFGGLFGYLSISCIVDNLGRKFAIIITSVTLIIGMVMVAGSQNIYLSGVGLFLMGFGGDSGINICFYFISQTVSDRLRQRFSIIIQCFFCIGGIADVLYFYVIKDWRLIFWFCYIIPMVLLFLAILIFIQQTPVFLLSRYSSEKALQSLNRIGRINSGDSEILTMQDIQSVKSYNVSLNQSKKQLVTPLDLFKHKSIRLISICVCGISFILYFLYYGPLMLIENFGFNIYINGLILGVSQLLSYIPSSLLIRRIRRKLMGIVFFTLALLFSIVLIFVKHVKCDFCFDSFLQLGLFFGFRFCVSFQFAIFLLYTNQLFPNQVVGLGLGISSALGTVASTCTPILIGQIKNNGSFPVAVLFAIGSGINVILSALLPQTKGRPLKQFVTELQSNKGSSNLRNGKGIQLVEQMDQQAIQRPSNKSFLTNQQKTKKQQLSK